MAELFNKKFYDYERNRDLVLAGNCFEQCCIILAQIVQKNNDMMEPGEIQSSLHDNGPSPFSSLYQYVPFSPSKRNIHKDQPLSLADQDKLTKLMEFGYEEEDIKRIMLEHPDCTVI